MRFILHLAIEEVQDRESRVYPDRSYINVKYSVVGQPEFPTLWDNLPMTEQARWRLEEFFQSLGIPGKIMIDPPDLVQALQLRYGATLRATISSAHHDQFGSIWRVLTYLPPKELHD